jgi:gas vesicle protein
VAKNKNKTRKSRGGFLLGLIVGIAIGAAAAALFIPSFGGDNPDVESDDLLKRAPARYGQVVERLRVRYGDAWSLGQDAYARAKDELTSRYAQAKAGE